MHCQVSRYQVRVGDRIQNFNPSSLVDGKIVVEVELSLMQLYIQVIPKSSFSCILTLGSGSK